MFLHDLLTTELRSYLEVRWVETLLGTFAANLRHGLIQLILTFWHELRELS